MLRIDHVVYAVEDLDEAALGFRQTHGLDSVAGGRHERWGTANRIVPLGDQYLELVATVDPGRAGTSGFGRDVLRQAAEGGSWHVEVSLAATGRWLAGLGRCDGGLASADPKLADVVDLTEELPSGFGRLRAIRHAAVLSEPPARWSEPAVPLGTHPPRWPRAGQRSDGVSACPEPPSRSGRG